jgi:hypothetical protein
MFRLYILTREIRGSEKEIPGHKISFMLVKMVFLGELKVLAVFNKLRSKWVKFLELKFSEVGLNSGLWIVCTGLWIVCRLGSLSCDCM